ncbi:MAG: RDD family protein [Pseudomonadota bacterium]
MAQQSGHHQTSDLALATATGVGINLEFAAAGSRAYAFIIDWHIRILLGLLWILAWLGIMRDFNVEGAFEGTSNLLWGFLAPSLIYMLYHPVLEVLMRGNSPGKKYAGVAVVDVAGNEPSTGAVLLRNIMRLIDSLPGFYLVGLTATIVTKEHIRLGDMVAGTRLVVARGSDEDALAQLQRIRGASIDPDQAELVYDLLERWSVLTADKRQSYARTILTKVGIEPSTETGRRADRALREQLQGLLGS